MDSIWNHLGVPEGLSVTAATPVLAADDPIGRLILDAETKAQRTKRGENTASAACGCEVTVSYFSPDSSRVDIDRCSEHALDPNRKRAARSKRTDLADAPSQQKMRAGIKPAERKAPTADQKRVRRNMTKKAGGYAETRYDEDGWPLCQFCDNRAVSWERLTTSTYESEKHYRCADHQRTDLAPNTSSGNIADEDMHKTSSTTASSTIRTAHEESTMTAQSNAQTEAELVARLAAATTLSEQADLSARIEEVRAARRESLAQETSLDWEGLNTPTQTLFEAAMESGAPAMAPMTASVRLGHTEATDWLADLTPTHTEDAVMSARVRAMATRWYEDLWTAVKETPQEFSVQAHNAARREGMEYGLQSTAAASVFLDQVSHLASREGIDFRPRTAAEYAGGSPKEGDTAKCHKDGGAIQFFDGQWMHLRGTGSDHNDVHPATPKEQAEKDSKSSSLFTAMEETTETYVSDGRTTQPVGVESGEADTFDEWGIGSDLNGDDPKSTNNSAAPSLQEGDAPETGKDEGVDNPNYGQTDVDKSTYDVGNTEDKALTQQSSRRTAISLTNVGIEGENGVGTDPSGKRVKFRLSEKDKADLKAVLYSDLAVNFSGVDVEESDIISDSTTSEASIFAHMAKTFGSNSRGIQTYAEGDSTSADGLSSADAPEYAPSMAEGDAPETGHSEPSVQEPGQGAQDLSHATDSDRPGGGVEWGSSGGAAKDQSGAYTSARTIPLATIGAAFRGRPVSANTATFAASLERVGSIHDSVGGVSARQIVALLLRAPDVPGTVKQALSEHLAKADHEHRFNSYGICSVEGCDVRKPGTATQESGYFEASRTAAARECQWTRVSEPGEDDGLTWWECSTHGKIEMGGETEEPSFPCEGWLDENAAENPYTGARKTAQSRPLYEIARDIRANWPNPYFGAVPYLDALGQLSSMDDMFYDDDAQTIVAYLLSNMGSKFKGPEAARLKAELKALVSRTSARHTAEEGQTCSVCGDKIAKDPNGEDPSTWHHDNGEKHDHEAKPGGGDSKEGRRQAAAAPKGTCSVCGEPMEQEGDGSWSHMPGHPDDHEAKPGSKEGRRAPFAREAARDTGTCGECGAWVSYDSDSKSWTHDNGSTDHAVKDVQKAASLTLNATFASRVQAGMAKVADGPTNTFPCKDCGATVERWRGEYDVNCPNCGAPHNAGGQRLRDDWASNPSNYDDEIGDMEGYEMSQLRYETSKGAGRAPFVGSRRQAAQQPVKASDLKKGDLIHIDSQPPLPLKVVSNPRRKRVGGQEKVEVDVLIVGRSGESRPRQFSPDKTLSVTRYEASRTVAGRSCPECGMGSIRGGECDYCGYLFGDGDTFSISDAKNEDGEWIMSPEQIRAEMNYEGSRRPLRPTLSKAIEATRREATRYCPTHKVYVGEGNQEQHDHCPVETRKKKESAHPRPDARRTAMPNPVDLGINIGDIFYSSWGYDQTNIDFYEVTGLTGASVRLRPIRSKVVESMTGGDKVVAVPGQFVGGEMLKRIQGTGEPGYNTYVSLNSYSNAYLWDGQPKFTNSAYGR